MSDDLISLLYVSEATHSLPMGDDPVEGIMAVAVPRNAQLGVTGALIFTGRHFAQVLEGSRESVDALMLSISKDSRHRNIDVVETEALPSRRFADWSLAYAGPSLFVARQVAPLVEGRLGGEGAMKSRRLIELMQEFAASQSPAR